MSGIIVKAIQTERSQLLQERRNQFTFIVSDKANKIQIAKAIEDMYNVEVESVNTMRYGGGKKKAKYTTKGISYERNPNFKKAIITLAEGDVIDLYSAI